MNVRTATGEKFVLERAINRGGEAQIWTVQHDPHLIAKLYHKPTAEHQAKLTAMITTPLTRTGSHPTVAWPLHLLYRQDDFVGYLMPRAASSLPLFHYYNPARRQRLGLPHAWPRFLHRTATNLAAAVELVHAHQHVIGDLNESNVLVTQAALVTLVDTDSFQIRLGQDMIQRAPSWLGGLQTIQTYRCSVGKPEYTPPELHGVDFKSVDRTPHHDDFALAVLVFYLLMEGFHPFAGVLTTGASVGRVDLYGIKQGFFPYVQWGATAHNVIQPPPGAPAFAHLHPGIQDAFRRTFTHGHVHPERRVTAKEWKKILHEAEAALISCPQNSTHFYSRHLRHCPVCVPTPPAQPPSVRAPAPPTPTQVAPLGVPTVSAVVTNLPVRWAMTAWLAIEQQLTYLPQIKVKMAQWQARLQHAQRTYQNYAKEAQILLATLRDRLTAVGQMVRSHAGLLGGWLMGNLTGTLFAGLLTILSYALLPQVARAGALSMQGQAMLLVLLFGALLGTRQAYTLRHSLLPSRYLRYGWVGMAALAGATVGAAGVRLLGPDWDQVSRWPEHPLSLTVLAATFGLLLGFLQSLLLRQQVRLADDGRGWTLVNGMSGVLTAQGWLWGQGMPYTWQLPQVADWQINGGLGALAGVGLGSLLSGGLLLAMAQGPRHQFYLHHFALGLLHQPPTARRLRKGVIRWRRALLLLILFWFFLQIIAQLQGAAASGAPAIPNEIIPHLLPLS